jgi:basic membrane lipoprotein Med (substrate-binding protein (PBP1-ABC) superfamily)
LFFKVIEVFKMIAILVGLIAIFASTPSDAFTMQRSSIKQLKKSSLQMGYLPDGFTQKQWDALQKKEQDDKKTKLDKQGTTKFRSRSFEAWQKAGGKHLFPVDPVSTPYEVLYHTFFISLLFYLTSL